MIIGTIIGAGFASRKGKYIFFSKYGLYGIIGILFSGTILGILTSKVLKIIGKEQKVNTYNEFLFYIFNNKNSKLVVILNYIINTFY